MVEVPFCTLVEVALDIPFSQCHKLDPRDLLCQLEEAEVVAQCEEEYKDDHGRIGKIVQKDVVRVVVKVERLEQFKVAKMGDCHFSTYC
ncbi:MAG: hypothetical protein DIU70_001480 [Bacillota bacterium]|nr:MAG: hypothetical protein DIU70_12885 [Bacillota bacterium]